MKRQLFFSEAKRRQFNWYDCVRYYFKDATDKFCDYVLYEKTCFPLHSDMALKQLYQFYLEDNSKRTDANK